MPRKRKNERADGRIQLSAVIGHDASGKLMRKYFYGATRLEAQRKKDEYLQIQKHKPPVEMTVSDWIDEYRRIYPSKSNPLYEQQTVVPYNRLKAALGDRYLSSIIEADLQKFLNTLRDYSASTISKQLQVIKSVFAKARKNKLISEDPAEDLAPPKGSKGTHRALTQAEVALILKYYPQAYSGLWVMIMLFAGLRRSEMIALDWSCVNLTERTLTVKQVGVIHNNQMIVEPRTKSQAGLRIIPITEPLYNALQSVPAAHKSGFVCLSAHHKPLTEAALKRGVERFIRIIDRAERNQPLTQSGRRTDKKPEPKPAFTFRCHDLRHSFCTMLYSSGVDVKTAAYLMGHSDITVTMRIYTHLSEQRKTRSTTALLDYFGALKTDV